MQVSWPVDNLAVCIVRFLCTERRPSNETFEHNSTYTPPVAAVVITLATEDLGSDVIRGADSRVCELATRFAPGVYLVSVADSQLDLVE